MLQLPPTSQTLHANLPLSQDLHNIEMLKSSPFVSMGSKRTPKVAAHNPNNYEISPYRWARGVQGGAD
jgi:hypothetical protein